jgi:chromosome segregation ATPase
VAKTALNIKINATFDELTQLAAEAQRSRDKLDAMAAASKILGKSIDNTDAAVDAHVRSLKVLQQNLDRNSAEYRQAQQEIKRYSKELRNADDENSLFDKGLSKLGGSIKSFGAAAVAAFTFDSIKNFIKELTQSAIDIENYAVATGTTVEQMSNVAIAAKKAGVDVNDLGDILKDLVEKIDILERGDAGEQELNLVRGLRQVGVELQNVDGSYRDAIDILVDYGNATRNLTRDQELARNAMLVLENSNMQFLPSVENLSEELKKQPALTREQVRALKDLQAAQVDFNAEMQRLALRILPGVVDALGAVYMATKRGAKSLISSDAAAYIPGLTLLYTMEKKRELEREA